MLWVLRKVFGVIALVWVLGWLLSLVSCLVDPKAAGQMLVVMYFSNIIGIPSSIIWAVLKIISVLGTRRMEQPAPVAAWYPPSPVSTSSVLGLTTPAVLPQAKRSKPPSSPSPAGPDVYTYSAPGMPMCPQCEQRPTIFYCYTHQSAVCLECVAKHDRPGECVYVPAFRAPKPTVEEAVISEPPKPKGNNPANLLGID